MKYSIIFLVTIYFNVEIFCQSIKPSTVITKPAIGSKAIANWVQIDDQSPSISPNGKYFMYFIYNLPVGSKTLVIQSTENNWKKEFIGADKGIFSLDSKQAIFQSLDSLFLVDLGKEKSQFITGISSFNYPKTKQGQPNSNSGKLVVYQLKQNNQLIIKSLVTTKEFKIDNVSSFSIHQDGLVMLVKKVNKDPGTEMLEWIDVATNKEKIIWTNDDNKNLNLINYQFDVRGNQAVLFTTDKENNSNAIWYYKQGMATAMAKVSNSTPGVQAGMIVSNSSPKFSETGNYIFFKVTSKPEKIGKVLSNAVQVDVWNYKDLVMQPLQTYFKNKNKKIPEYLVKAEFTSCIAIDNGYVTQIENDSERIVENMSGDNDFVVTIKCESVGDKVWRKYQETKFYLTTLNGKVKKYLRTSDPVYNLNTWLPPNKNFLVYFDSELKQYMSYDIAKGITKNISEHIPVSLTNEISNESYSPNITPTGIAGWLDNGNLLIYDNYDIWMLDPSGQKPAENITNGYGRANNIKFDLVYPTSGMTNEDKIYSATRSLLLTAFYGDTKQNGFFKVDLRKKTNPQLLSLHSSLIYAIGMQTSEAVGSENIIKAANNGTWIVKKQRVDEAPNFYSTSDFKTFQQLTDIQPQKNYRWATTDLISWKMPDGNPCQGILYKPENFDSTKKYPVIVYYYEKVSGELHEFLKPDFTSGGLDIPWFVSREYLVFSPDIHYTINHVSQSVVNSVIPGIHELLKRSYVDSSAIGIQGQSFGGYETNVLVTESRLFAAAAEGAGATDFISKYGSLLPTDRDEGSGASHQEKGGQYRLSSTLWENPQAYIENSPIFKANKVTTPLLIRHNKGDEAVAWGQAVEMFIALRRLDKPVWMLQYDEGGHVNTKVKDKIDYTIRLTQFYDHYLKGAPAPSWLTQGIPATLKGVITGYELDPAGSCGKDCKVCKMWNEKFKMDSAATIKEVEDISKSEVW